MFCLRTQRLGGTTNPLDYWVTHVPYSDFKAQQASSCPPSTVHLQMFFKIKEVLQPGILHVCPGRSTDHGRGQDQLKVRGETRRLSTPAQELMPQTSSVKPATRRPTAGRPSPGPVPSFKGRTSSRQPAATYSRLSSHSRCLLSCRLELQASPQASNRMNGPSCAEPPKQR